MTHEKTWVGIDVSQAWLDIYVLPQALTLQQPNTEAGIQSLVEHLLLLPSPDEAVELTGILELDRIFTLLNAKLLLSLPKYSKAGFASSRAGTPGF